MTLLLDLSLHESGMEEARDVENCCMGRHFEPVLLAAAFAVFDEEMDCGTGHFILRSFHVTNRLILH